MIDNSMVGNGWTFNQYVNFVTTALASAAIKSVKTKKTQKLSTMNPDIEIIPCDDNFNPFPKYDNPSEVKDLIQYDIGTKMHNFKVHSGDKVGTVIWKDGVITINGEVTKARMPKACTDGIDDVLCMYTDRAANEMIKRARRSAQK